jgi:serine/threonine protein kinase
MFLQNNFPIEKIEELYLIDRGGNALIALANMADGPKALKLCPLKENSHNPYLNKELSWVKFLEYPFYSKLIGSCLTDTYEIIAFDYIPGIPLTLLAQLTPQKFMPASLVQQLAKQMLEHTLHLHKQNLAHTDLHLRQWLWTTNHQLFLTDFGSITKLHPQTHYCRRPTPMSFKAFYPFEVYLDDLAYDGKKVDTWELGFNFFFLITKKAPFPYSNLPDLESLISLQQISPPLLPEFNYLPKQERIFFEELALITQQMLNPWPENRPYIEDILKNPIFNEKLPQHQNMDFHPYPHKSSLNRKPLSFLGKKTKINPLKKTKINHLHEKDN